MSTVAAVMIHVLGALCSLQSKNKLSPEVRQENKFSRAEEKEKQSDNDVERETAGVRNRNEDAATVIIQAQEDVSNA
jgi:hypothetical protein